MRKTVSGSGLTGSAGNRSPRAPHNPFLEFGVTAQQRFAVDAGGSALEFFDDRSSQCVTVDAYQPRLQSVQFVRLHLQTLVFRDQPLCVRQ